MGFGLSSGGLMIRASEEGVDFFSHPLIPFHIGGQEVYLMTTEVCTLIVSVAIVIFALIARAKLKADAETPSGLQNFVEFLVESLDKVVDNSMGKFGKKYANYIGTIMLFIFISNISGLFGLRPPTGDYATTLSLALITFVLIQYAAIKTSKFETFTNLFKPIPLLFPINLIGEFATPLSLSLRLFGNIMAGTIMLALYYGLLPIFAKLGILAFLHVYFDLFSGAIQTYVFSMLTMVFITDKLNA